MMDLKLRADETEEEVGPVDKTMNLAVQRRRGRARKQEQIEAAQRAKEMKASEAENFRRPVEALMRKQEEQQKLIAISSPKLP